MRLLLLAALAWSPEGDPSLATGRVHAFVATTSDRPVRGFAAADVTMDFYASFPSPECAAAAGILRRVLGERPHAVRLVFHHLPQPRVRGSQLAAEMGEEAFAQGKFWEFHDAAFARAGDLRDDDLYRAAAQAGLDLPRARRAIESGRHRAAVGAEAKLARRRVVTTAPTLIVGSTRLEGGLSYESVVAAVDGEAARARQRAVLGVGAAPADPDAAGQPRRAPRPPVRRETIHLAGAPSRGRVGAPIVVVEFGDLADRAHPTTASVLAQLRNEYGDRVRHVFKHFPAKRSSAALHAVAAEAARQGRFWDLYDRLGAIAWPLASPREALERTALDLARAAGVDPAAAKAAIAGGTHDAEIERDAVEGRRVGLRRPGLFVNGRRVDGVPAYETLRTIAEEDLRGGLLQSFGE